MKTAPFWECVWLDTAFVGRTEKIGPSDHAGTQSLFEADKGFGGAIASIRFFVPSLSIHIYQVPTRAKSGVEPHALPKRSPFSVYLLVPAYAFDALTRFATFSIALFRVVCGSAAP